MPRDVNEFISEALKEGYDINDVVGFMSKHPDEEYQKWASNWSSTSAAPEYKTGSADQQIKFDEEKDRLRQEFDKKLKEATTTNVMGFDVPSILTGPATAITGAAALGGAYLLGKKGLQSRSIKNPQVAEAVGDIAKVESSPVDYNVPAYQRKATILETAGTPIPEPKQPSPMEILQKRASEIKSANQPQASAQPVAPGPIQRQPIPETVGAPPFAAPAPKAPVPPTTSVTEAVTAGQSPNQAIQATIAKEIDSAGGLRTGSGLPAVAGTGEQRLRSPRGGVYESAAKVPAGQAFVPGMGPGTNTVRQALGEEGYQQFVRQLGRPIGSDAEAKQLLKEFAENRVGPPVTREMRKSLGVAPLPNTPGIAMKAAKVAGVGGAILAMADLARAAQQTKEGEYKEAAKTVAPIIDPTGLSTAALEPQSTAQMLTSVSPVMGILSQLFGSKIQEKQKSKR